MKYELAKKLKDAGFPMAAWVVPPSEPYDIERRFTVQDGTYTKPTLSELIEACGDDFALLRSYATNQIVEQNWGARATHHGTDTMGTTPEEAVANLWLALNEKNPA